MPRVFTGMRKAKMLLETRSKHMHILPTDNTIRAQCFTVFATAHQSPPIPKHVRAKIRRIKQDTDGFLNTSVISGRDWWDKGFRLASRRVQVYSLMHGFRCIGPFRSCSACVEQLPRCGYLCHTF